MMNSTVRVCEWISIHYKLEIISLLQVINIRSIRRSFLPEEASLPIRTNLFHLCGANCNPLQSWFRPTTISIQIKKNQFYQCSNIRLNVTNIYFLREKKFESISIRHDCIEEAMHLLGCLFALSVVTRHIGIQLRDTKSATNINCKSICE